MSANPHIDALVALGMTPLEASVYEYLIGHAAATGYRIGRGIDKPTANTYKALASLQEKGAVVVDGGRRRLYRAVAPDELLNTFERRFMEHRRAAASGLVALATGRDDDRIYQLTTFDQVVERLRKMLGRCREVAVLNLSTGVVPRVAGDLEFAAEIGADVVVRVWEETEISGVRCVLANDGTAGGGVHTASAAIDGCEMLLATLDPEGAAVRRALWTAHRDMAAVVHRSIVAELMFAEIENGLSDGLSTDEIEETFETYRALRNHVPTG